MNLSSHSSPILPTDIIIDGKIIRKNLLELGKNDNWLNKELEKHTLSLSDVDKIFFMSLQEDGKTYISLKN